jgi:hypothetical protein
MIALVYVDYPDRMPSDRIRVFTLHADFPTPLSDPPDHAPISGHVREALDAGEGQIKLCLGLPSDVDPLDVSTDWTGVFTKNGHDLPDSDFRITEAAKDHTWAIVAGTTYPSKTVRLYPPHAAKRAETAEQ